VSSFKSSYITLDPETVFKQPPSRGAREKTTAELREEIKESAARQDPAYEARFMIQQKVSLPLACPILALIGLALGIVTALNIDVIVPAIENALSIKFLSKDVYLIPDLPSDLQTGDVVAVTLMALAVNWLAAGLLALTIAFYVFVYTMWLKRRTPQNIVIGGAAGAFPPMIGWAAVTGQISLASIALFLLIFMWTPPHFWALALYRTGDYAKAGVPMLPVVAGARATKAQMLVYTVLLFPIALAPWALGLTGAVYAAVAAILGLLFILAAVRVWFDSGERAARQMFAFSILYLFLLFTLMIVDRAPGLVGGSLA